MIKSTMEFDLRTYNESYWQERILNNPEFLANREVADSDCLTLDDIREIIEYDFSEQPCYDDKYLDENPF